MDKNKKEKKVGITIVLLWLLMATYLLSSCSRKAVCVCTDVNGLDVNTSIYELKGSIRNSEIYCNTKSLQNSKGCEFVDFKN